MPAAIPKESIYMEDSHMPDSEVTSPASLFGRMAGAMASSANPYGRKDLRKAKGSTKFIGRGSPASSTHRYMLAAGDLANSGHYTGADTVFVSAEGARRGRLVPNIAELWLAAEAGVTFVTDNEYDRTRAYNVGEREVAAVLRIWGYRDTGSGRWRRISTT